MSKLITINIDGETIQGKIVAQGNDDSTGMHTEVEGQDGILYHLHGECSVGDHGAYQILEIQ